MDKLKLSGGVYSAVHRADAFIKVLLPVILLFMGIVTAKGTITESSTTEATVNDDGDNGTETLFSTDFTESEWTGIETTSANTTATVTISDTKITLTGYKNNGFSVSNGSLTFPGNNMTDSDYFMAIPVTGINGSVTIEINGQAKSTFRYEVLDINTEHPSSTADYPTTTTVDNTSGNSKAENVETSLTSAIIFIGRQSSSYTSINSIKITTPSSSSTYTITYNMNDHGDAIADVTGATALPEVLPAPTAEGYTFSGWYTDEACTQQAAAGSAITANTTLYAKWTQNKYTVTATAANGTITITDGSGNTITSGDEVAHGTKLTFTAEANSGYNFGSWSVTGTTGTESGSTYTIASLDQATTVSATFTATGSVVTTTGTYPRSDMSTFGGRNSDTKTISKNLNGETTTGESDAVLTLSTSSDNVQAQGETGGTKVRLNGSFTINAVEGYTIKSIELVTDQKSRSLTSSLSAEPTADGSNYTYKFDSDTQSVKFTNNNSGNIYVYIINVTYEYIAASGKTPLTITFPQTQIEGYAGDTDVKLLIPTVKANGESIESGYEISYKSNNEDIVTINNDNTINLKAEGTAVITATVTPAAGTDYVGGSAVITVVSNPIPALTVSVADIMMNTTDAAQKTPAVTVSLDNTELKSSDYTLTYTLKKGENVDISNNAVIVQGTSGNWTAGTSTITVTATPTEDYASANKCIEGSADFTITVNKAGSKLTPTIDFPNEISLSKEITNTLTAYVIYNGMDVTDCFTFEYAITEKGGSTEATFNNAATGEFYTGTTVTGSTPVTVTITATPVDEYADQYNLATKNVTVNIKELGKITIDKPGDIEATVGDVIAFPEIVIKDENGDLISLDDVTITINSSSPSQVSVESASTDTKTKIMKAIAEGTATIIILVTSNDYMDANTSFTVTVTDPTIYTVQNEQNAPANGETVTTVPDITMTYGGWIFNPLTTQYIGKSFGTKRWGEAKKDDAGSLPNFPYAIMSNDQENPLDELGANCAPEGKTVDYNGKGYSMVDNMFCVPAEGAYFSFAPKTNGTVTAHVLQNGVFDNDLNNNKNQPVYKPNRRIFIIDETGTRLSDDVITAHLDVTTGTLPKAKKTETNTINGTSFSFTEKDPITAIGAYKTDNKDDNGNTIYLSPEYAFGGDIGGLSFTFTDGAVTNFVNGLYKRLTNEGKDGLTGGWVVLSKAPVTYSFPVKAGKTYYLYCFGSKLSLYGYEFKPDNDVTVDEVSYSETTTANSISVTADSHVAQVSIDREFVSGIWNACVLPFSLNNQQVDAIFGHTYDKDNTTGTQILYFDRTEGSTIHFVRHAYNTIVAGKPFLIKPSKTGTIKIIPENMGGYPYVTIEKTQAESFGRDKETADYYWASSYNAFSISPGDYFIRDWKVNGKAADGNIVRYPTAQTENLGVNGFRGYLKAKDDATRSSARSLTVAFSDLGSGETTYIENVEIADDGTLRQRMDGKVYSIQGQLVCDDASKINSLPKGIYIVNGTKVSVK